MGQGGGREGEMGGTRLVGEGVPVVVLGHEGGSSTRAEGSEVEIDGRGARKSSAGLIWLVTRGVGGRRGGGGPGRPARGGRWGGGHQHCGGYGGVGGARGGEEWGAPESSVGALVPPFKSRRLP